MPFSKQNIRFTLNGILFVVLFSVAAMQISDLGIIKNLGLSPLIIGILIGMIYANTLRNHLPKEWVPGILFSSKTILRVAIVFYGFRITFQQIGAVGLEGLVLSSVMLTSTFLLGSFLGQKVFGLDRDTSLLISSGSSVCGAAAVLATEPVLKAEPYKSAIAVATVVVFGTTGMFLYPILFHAGFLPMTVKEFGLYVGGTVHEVAQVVGASAGVSDDASKVAVIVKMTRVMMIAPLLIVLGLVLSALARKKGQEGAKLKLVIPWFAVLFIGMSGVNSLGWIPSWIVSSIHVVDTFLLTMAMTALGMETDGSKFKKAGFKPILLALTLFVWLVIGGFFVTKGIVSVL
jgi:uncharacterized integral membrane protein (TIGR00698 family)